MDIAHHDGAPRSYWFVGASYGGTEDQTSRFLEEGIWENGYDDKYLDQVRSMRPGDRIAIKSTYTRKRGLPFDNRGGLVSVMAIKAIGTIAENPGDGKFVRVNWTDQDAPLREWYFFTLRSTIQQVISGENWKKDELIDFAFEGKPQDIDRFINDPRQQERHRTEHDDQRFHWTKFYAALAEKLLGYQSDRGPLIEGIHDIAARVGPLSILQDRFADGSTGPLADICPFTTMGTFNRGMTDANRQAVAREIADFLGVEIPAPGSFPGIPVVNNQRTWFFAYSKSRGDGDIDALWNVFAAALRFAHADSPESRADLTEAYDRALEVWGVAWNLSMALYWARPWDFVPLDALARNYISKELGMRVPTRGKRNPAMARATCNSWTSSRLCLTMRTVRSTASRSFRSRPGTTTKKRSHRTTSLSTV